MISTLKYLIVLLTILISGSTYFGVLGWKIKILIYGFCFIILLRERKDISLESIGRFLILSVFLTFNIITRDSSSASVETYKKVIITLGMVFCICNTLSKSDIVKILINEIMVLSIISVICFILLNTGIVNGLPFEKLFHQGNGIYKVAPYYTLGISYGQSSIYDISRNAGVWWEPGAWQAIVNICLLLLLANISMFTKKQIFFRAAIFIITILTTQSSTGYMILLIIAIFSLKYLFKDVRIMAVLIVLAITMINFVPIDKVVYDKVLNQKGSFNTRYNDIISTYKIWFKNPILGIGVDGEEHVKSEKEYGIYANSNGLGVMFESFGMIFGIIYIYYLSKGFYSLCLNKNIPLLAVIIILVIIHSTEYFIFNTTFLIFLFPFFQIPSIEKTSGNKYLVSSC